VRHNGKWRARQEPSAFEGLDDAPVQSTGGHARPPANGRSGAARLALEKFAAQSSEYAFHKDSFPGCTEKIAYGVFGQPSDVSIIADHHCCTIPFTKGGANGRGTEWKSILSRGNPVTMAWR